MRGSLHDPCDDPISSAVSRLQFWRSKDGIVWGSCATTNLRKDGSRNRCRWVLSFGGPGVAKVTILVEAPQQKPREVEVAKDLPAGDFQLLRIELSGNPKMHDTALENLKDLRNLTHIVLNGDKQVMDAALAHLKGLPNLTHLELRSTSVTDAGLIHLEKLTELKELDLTGTQVTKEGVTALEKKLPKCKIVWDAK